MSDENVHPSPDWEEFYSSLGSDEYDPSPTTKVTENSDVFDRWLEFLDDFEMLVDDETDAEADAYLDAVGEFLNNPNATTLSACRRIASVPDMVDIVFDWEKKRKEVLAKMAE
jgi:hypothetical protein